MNSPDNYYTKSLYPFQDGVLDIVKKSGLPFYLTGGTALSRGYFNHRYSDDLDFFINDSPEYASLVNRFIEELENGGPGGILRIDKKKVRRSQHFTQIFVYPDKGDIELKIDLVNDISYRVGDVVSHRQLRT